MTRNPGTQREQSERQLRALEDIERAAAQSEVVGTSALRRQVERAAGHFRGEDADQDDRVEVWGRRIGRGLSVIGFTVLLVYLIVTYL
jgi:hypothetical protein